MSAHLVLLVAAALLVCGGPPGRDPARWLADAGSGRGRPGAGDRLPGEHPRGRGGRSSASDDARRDRWLRRAGSGARPLAGALADVGSALRSGRSPDDAWRDVLGCACGPDGVPDADDLLTAVSPVPGWRRLLVRVPVPVPRRVAVRGREAALARRVEAVVAAGRLAASLGAPLAPVLDRIAESLVADDEVDSERLAALAGPRSTARLLGWLPLLGLVLGVALGADPWGVVVRGGVGALAAGVGVVLLAGGRVWTSLLVRRALLAGST